MEKFIRIGVDLAKNYFQVHALASESSPGVKRKLTRSNGTGSFRKPSPALSAWEPAARRIMSYMDEGVQLLELGRNAQRLFANQGPREKRRLLNFVLIELHLGGRPSGRQ